MKLIDANRLRDAVLDLPNCYNGYSDTYDKSLIIGLIDEQIVVDAVPVVRCKDCRYNYGNAEGREYNPNDIVCTYFDTDGMDANDYCSYGERKEDGVDR